VRAQTFTDYEIIVVSNGESDAMRERSHAVAAVHDCRYFALPKGNVSVARNFAIASAKGEWIAFVDDDDLWIPTKLERQLAKAERTGADMIACDYAEFYPDGREIIQQPRLIEGWSYTKALSRGYWWAAPSTVTVRKCVFADIGAFDARQRYIEDDDMWRRISWRHTIHQMDEILVRYRIGHLSATHPRFARIRYFYNLRHFIKMHLDTPRHLRPVLPSLMTYHPLRLSWLAGAFAWGPHPWLRPRTRWNAFRRWLRA
jgi:glycosyltransferase involved in cell wall biosynthesis